MEITKKGGNILISELKINELFTFLKCQIPSKLLFGSTEISLVNRDFINNENVLEIDFNGKSQIISYNDLLSKISLLNSKGYETIIEIPVDVFKSKEPLIMLINNIKDSVIQTCIYIDYNNNTFEIKNKSFPNGDSDKLYYFELNDTILAFSKTGPVLITDNNKINSIEDLIGN
jgi:hypothetical protein